MSSIDWQNVEQITVLGLGKSGLSVLRYLQRQFNDAISDGTLQITAFDSREQAPGREQASALIGAENVFCRRWQLEDTLAADVLVLSPGIDAREEPIELAMQAGVIVTGDVELFAQQVRQPVVAITGSNGKSTVTRMVEHIARRAGINALAAGNIGLPVLDALAQNADAYVLELSSFQLETLNSLRPKAATVLNISPDHMDRYPSLADYTAAKLRIYQGSEIQVLNRQQPECWPTQCSSTLRFGDDDATEFGLIRHQDETWISYQGKRLLGAHQLTVQGLHNLLNAQAALALSSALGISVNEAARHLVQFFGLPHRCQLVTERNGVKWVNDSKATNIGATEAAIKGMRPIVAGKLILIAGGEGKGADFSALQASLKQVDVLLTIGKDGPAIGALFNGSRQLQSLEDAVALASTLSEPGDMVLLSPACASFDQFDNFEHRGDVFARAVEAHDEQSA